jgi:transcriptional regulator with XRE-family HTH domain
MPPTRKSTASKKPEQERVGETLQALRDRYGYTQEMFAQELGISRSHLSNIEAGIKPLTDHLLFKCAALLGVKPLAIKRYDTELIAA